MRVKKEYFHRYEGPLFHERIKPHFQDFHKLTMEGDYEYPVHIHNNYEIILTVRTKYHCNLNGTELTVRPGEFLVIKPGDRHLDHLFDGQFHYVLHFTLMSENKDKTVNIEIFPKSIPAELQIGRLSVKSSGLFFRQLEEELTHHSQFSDYIQDALMESFFWKILRGLQPKVISEYLHGCTINRHRQIKLYDIFEKNSRKNISINDIAKLMGMSKRSLNYFCNKNLQQSPVRAFISFKMAKAREMLLTTDITIKEVSDQLGFDNQFHFSRVFKRMFGKSPKNLRIHHP